jgi:hypothetical protein
MNAPTPFQVTPEALKVIASLLQQHPEMQPGLMLIPSFEYLDEQGAVETRIESESFWMGYDSPDKFSSWPRIELCGQSVPVAPDALERLKGMTLDIQLRDVEFGGEKEPLKLLVAA